MTATSATQRRRTARLDDVGMLEFEGVRGGIYRCVQTLPQFEAFLDVAMQQSALAVDTETSGLDWVKSDVCGVVVGWGIEQNYYLPIAHKTDEKQLDLQVILPGLQMLFGREDTTKIFWNAKFDLHGLRKCGIEVRGLIHDPLLIAWILNENSSHALKDLSVEYVSPDANKWETLVKEWRVNEAKRRRSLFLAAVKEEAARIEADADVRLEAEAAARQELGAFDEEDPAARKKLLAAVRAAIKTIAARNLKDEVIAQNKIDDVSYDYIPLDLITPYACADVHYTWLLHKKFIVELCKTQTFMPLYQNEVRLTMALFEMEHSGAKIDRAYLTTLGPKYDIEAAKEAAEIFEAVGYTFNISSDAQLIEALSKVGVTLTKETKGSKDKARAAALAGEEHTPKFAVDKDVLEALAVEHPFAAKVLKYRGFEKFKSTYVEGILDKLDADDVVHANYNQNVSTGRMSANSPNLTNIPARDKVIRKAFLVPGADYIWVFVDYCLAGGTLVDTPRGHVAIEDMRTGDYVYTYNRATQKPDCSKVAAMRFTGTKETLVVVLDNGQRVRCTPDHRWLTHAGEEVYARDLAVGTRLLPLRRSTAGQKKYETLYSRSSREYVYAHHVVGAAKEGIEVGELYNTIHEMHVHHKDGDSHNNDPDNLEYKIAAHHRSEHGRENATRQWADPDMRLKMSAGISRAKQAAGGHHGARNSNFGNRKGLPRQCAACNKTFYKAPSMQAIYCSKACYFAARRGEADLNHRVVEIVRDGLMVPTYDLEVARDHNFALAAGVFVHNSQVELRLTADRSEDPILMSCYPWEGEGNDVHTLTLADVVLNQPVEQVLAMKEDKTGHVEDPPRGEICKCPKCAYDFYRNIAKRVNFGIIYGAQAPTIQRQVSTPTRPVSKEECEEYIRRYFQKYRGVHAWIKDTHAFLKKYGWVRNTFGRYRRIDVSQFGRREFWKVERACRQAVNYLVQGEAADIFKTSVVRVHELLRREKARTRLVNVVHDEIQFYWHRDELHLLEPVRAAMEDYEYKVPLIAEFSFSETDWGAKKSLKF